MKRLLQFFTIALAIGAMIQSVVQANSDKAKGGSSKEATKGSGSVEKAGPKQGNSTFRPDGQPGI